MNFKARGCRGQTQRALYTKDFAVREGAVQNEKEGIASCVRIVAFRQLFPPRFPPKMSLPAFIDVAEAEQVSENRELVRIPSHSCDKNTKVLRNMAQA